MNFKVSNHAREEMKRRGIPQKLLDAVLNNPQQVAPEREGKKVYQSQVDFGQGKIFLLRVIVADDTDPAIVITVYRTSRIEKYWR
ncbi:MAG: hypothetical protein FD130_1451 [Halothiobacillaceae bacterium]|nr:MAG: hypothetical protein FD130_1451 [Halothiobacillaceae bacterium]